MGSPRAAFFLMSALVLGGSAPPALERWSEGPQQVSQAIPAEAITERLLALLPDDQIIQSGNERTTVKELRAMRAAEQEKTAVAMLAAQHGVKAKFDNLQRALANEEEARLNAAAETLKKEIARRRQREVEVERVRQEAIVLFNKARSASGADRDKIGRRAAELLNTLNKLGVR